MSTERKQEASSAKVEKKDEAVVSEDPATEEDDKKAVPTPVKDLIGFFFRHVNARNLPEVTSVYESSFYKLTNRLFTETRWPEVENILPLVNNDKRFKLLYSELYYRHVYDKFQPSVEDRVGSWTNYTQLFDLFLEDNNVVLPDQWLWDMIDEFIYQFQNYHIVKFKCKKTAEHSTKNPDVWSASAVLHYLNQLVQKSGIVQHLQNSDESEEQTEETGRSALHTLGYFSLVGLLRVHSLLGDFNLAVKSIQPINTAKKSHNLYTKVTGCYVTLSYYLSFSYLIMRRYNDAVRLFSSVLLFISRTERHHTRSYQYEEILKKTDQMYTLLAMALALSPQPIDDIVQRNMEDKLGDVYVKLSQLDLQTFDDQFLYACPKFIIPAAVSDKTREFHFIAGHQKELFLNEITQQKVLQTVRSYLKLYTSITVAKLASFLNITEQTLQTHLLGISHKAASDAAHNTQGGIFDGGVSPSDVHFYIDNDTIYIVDSKATPRFDKFFINAIDKFAELTYKLEASI